MATVQGLPRTGRRQFGVPPGGAFDQESLALANALVANDASVPALELGLGALEATVLGALALVVVGARCEVLVNDRSYKSDMSYSLAQGDHLFIKAPIRGARLYLATTGGWRGTWGRGEVLSSAESRSVPSRKLAEPPTSLRTGPLRVVLGAQANRYLASFLEATYEVSPLIDRMGLRLKGDPLPKTAEIVSEPCIPGTIQVANDGALLIHGPDGPTIGGYPKLAHVISADLDRLGQLRPGDSIQFEVVDVASATTLWSQRRGSVDGVLRVLNILQATKPPTIH